MKSRRSKNKRQRASAMVEAALLLPVVIFLIFGVLQWCLIISASLTLKSASAAAARLVALTNPPPIDAQLEAAARDAVTPELNPAPAVLGVIITAGPGGLGKRVNLTYAFPLILPYVVPGRTGNTFVLTSSSTGR